jgi:hypothetical protein
LWISETPEYRSIIYDNEEEVVLEYLNTSQWQDDYGQIMRSKLGTLLRERKLLPPSAG